MSIATITSKGQVTIPKDVRDALGLRTGEKIDFRVDEQKKTVTVVPLSRKTREVFGLLQRKRQRPVSVEEMNEAIARRMRSKHAGC